MFIVIRTLHEES